MKPREYKPQAEGLAFKDLLPEVDKLNTGTSLVLALYRMAEQEDRGGPASPAQIIAWQAFLALSVAVDRISDLAGIDPIDRGIE